MSSDETKQAAPKSAPDGMPRNVLLGLLVICLAAIGVVVYLALRPADTTQETIIALVEVSAPEEADVNVLHVIDTTEDTEATAVEGQRYKVLIVDEAREGANGIARIGGLVTFVPGAKRGDLLIIEVTRIRRSTADAIVIERLAEGVAVPGRPERRAPTPQPERAVSAMVGQVFRGVVEDVGREGDGIVRVDGKVVFVEGSALGEDVSFEVAEDMGRFARGVVLERFERETSEPPAVAPRATAEPAPEAEPETAYTRDTLPPVDTPDQSINIGSIYDVTVTEQDRRNPDVDGVARRHGLVIFVPGTQPGDRARVRITSLQQRSASSVVIYRYAPDEEMP